MSKSWCSGCRKKTDDEGSWVIKAGLNKVWRIVCAACGIFKRDE